MKTILTLIFFLLIGLGAQAQNETVEVKVETVTMDITTASSKQDVVAKTNNTVARLYMFKNSKITKELSFSTKLNKAKLA